MENISKNIEVYKAINSITEELAKEGIKKENKNLQQGYMFRGIDDIYNTLAQLLAKYKLCIIPNILERIQEERQTAKGGTLFYTTVKAQYNIVSSVDGSIHTAIVYGEAMDSADKSTNKAMSAAYKYLCLQTFCIPTEGDNDADKTTPDPVLPKVQKTTPIQKITQEQEQKLEELGIDKIALCNYFKVNTIKDLTIKQAQIAINKKEQQNKE